MFVLGRKKEDSELWPYISALPKLYKMVLINWPDKYDHFLMKSVLDTKERLQDRFKQRYDRIDKSYNTQHRMTWVREEELKHAYLTIKSRAIKWPVPTDKRVSDHPITLKHCLALAPVFDLFNHNSKPNCEWKVTSSVLEIVATEDVKPGQELFVTYG